mgnify:FL=1
MRQSTLILQVVCVLLGGLFIVTGLYISDQILQGGLLLGSVMCVSAAFLGADHTTNSGNSRGVFKLLAVISSLPIIGVCIYSAILSFGQSDWASAFFSLLKAFLVVAVLVLLAIDTTPRGKMLLHQMGLSRPEDLTH